MIFLIQDLPRGVSLYYLQVADIVQS